MMKDDQPPFLEIQFIKNKGQITDKLLCYLCKKILRSPIKQCPICQRLACKLCLEKQPNDGFFCLFSRDCQQEFSPDISHQKQLQQYRDISIENIDPLQDWILLHNLDQLEIQCPYSFNPDPQECCQQINLKHQEFLNHSINCRYKQIKCENNLCQETYIRQNKINHLKICQFVKIQCIWCNDLDYKIFINNHQDSCIYKKKCQRCQLFFSSKRQQEHDQECLFLYIDCSGCHQYMIRKEFNEHKSVCPEIYIECKCGESIQRKKYEQHSQTQCIMKTIKNMSNQLKNFNISIKEKVRQQKEKTHKFSIDQYIFNNQIEQEEQMDIKVSWIFDIHQQMSKYGYVSSNSSLEERNSSDKEDTFLMD